MAPSSPACCLYKHIHTHTHGRNKVQTGTDSEWDESVCGGTWSSLCRSYCSLLALCFISFLSVLLYISEFRSLAWLHTKRKRINDLCPNVFGSTPAGEQSVSEDRLYLYVILSKCDFQTMTEYFLSFFSFSFWVVFLVLLPLF